MIYYKSNYLSEKLGIKLAKWKRWSREFLDPDPLGGLQSGVARQFNLREAFQVYLGGYLVSELKFTIPEALKIVAELSPWLKANGFFSIAQLRQAGQSAIPGHLIFIYPMPDQQFAYAVRTLLAVSNAGDASGPANETFAVSWLGSNVDPLTAGICTSADVVAITALFTGFCQRIE
jgi:hypothetical protein